MKRGDNTNADNLMLEDRYMLHTRYLNEHDSIVTEERAEKTIDNIAFTLSVDKNVPTWFPPWNRTFNATVQSTTDPMFDSVVFMVIIVVILTRMKHNSQ